MNGLGHEALGTQLAFLNACLNGTAGLVLILGRVAIARQARGLHQRLMTAAFLISALFLVSYLTRVVMSGTHAYPGVGGWRTVYFTVLISHMLLAIVTPGLAIRAIWLARRQRFDEHRRLARWLWPIWMYVSVTGVVVYVLLYHPPG